MNWARPISCAAVLAAAAGSGADAAWAPRAAALQPSGSVRAGYSSSSKSLDGETHLAGATVQLKLQPRLGPKVDGKVEARLTSAEFDGGRGGARATLLEGYVSFRFEKIDLRLGRQIVAWGRADGINPTDNLTPRDHAVVLPFEEDQRLGTPAAKLDAYLTERHTLTVFTTPWFEPGRIPLPAAQRGAPHALPPRRLDSSEVGLRLNRVGEGLDWSLCYFHGYRPLPSLHLAASSALALRHDRIDVAGADFARNFGRFGVRGEAAYTQTRDRAGQDPFVMNPQFFWVLGVDRTFGENLNLNVQWFQRRVRGHRDQRAVTDADARPVAILNAILAGQLDRVGNGVSFRASKQWLHDTLEAEIFGIVNLNHGDAFARPAVTYAFNDQWKATVGAELYDGPELTQFGSQRANRRLFAEVRWSFAP